MPSSDISNLIFVNQVKVGIDRYILLKGRTLFSKVWPFLVVIIFIFFKSNAFASDSTYFIDKANKLGLAHDPLWRDLLHYKGGRSQILEDDFFLSDKGSTDLQAELEATITAYFTQDQALSRESGDNNIVCIFPARYTWLNKVLDLPGFNLSADVCPKLSQWARLDEIDSVSLIYVSGYLGNPASSFGHVLLNLKIQGNDNLFGLFDTSISYGATVPLNENIFFYVIKGLLGGYYATFSDKPFYRHDQVYTSREFRDMWEYTLDLNDDEKKMLIYHIAELLTKRFKYFFLSDNCAQRVAVLLDAFIKEDVYNFPYPIYVPEELFHRLESIDRKRKEAGESGLIKSITYIPSARRKLYYETKRLNINELRVYRAITNHPDALMKPVLSELDVNGQIRVLNALLAYQYYKLLANETEQKNEKLVKFKDKILLERLRLPARKEEPVIIPDMPSPQKLSPPSSYNIGAVTDRDGDSFSTFGVTVFRKESIGLTALEYTELVALNLNLGFHFDSEDLFVETFDFIKIKDLKTFYIEEANENPFSWRVRAGVDRYHGGLYDYVLDGGVGLVSKQMSVGVYYGFVNASLHSLDQQYRLEPQIGFVLGNDALKLQVDYGFEFGLEDGVDHDIVNAKLQYQMNRRNALQFSFEKSSRERISMNYIYYW